MTFSIIGLDKKNGELGIAICSAIACIGEFFAFGEAQNGVVAAQGYMNSYNATKALGLLKFGMSPADIIDFLKNDDEHIEKRQISILSLKGDKACYTGSELVTGMAYHLIGDCHIAAGNMLKDRSTVQVMSDVFDELIDLPLTERLLRALEAGNKTPGDVRGRLSAALHVYAQEDYPKIKMNVDDDENPVEKLRKITDKYIKNSQHIMPFCSKNKSKP